MKKKVTVTTITSVLCSGLLVGINIFASENDNSVNDSPANDETNNVEENVVVKEEVSQEVESVKSNEFDLTLPAKAPDDAKYVINTDQKVLDTDTEITLTHLGDAKDREEDQWKIQILQERLPEEITQEKAMQVIAERYASKDIEEVSIGNYNAYIDYTSDKGEALNEIWVATDDYFYSIGAPFLSKEELIEVASSMAFD